MSSSQEKTLKNFNTIEKNIEKTIEEERKQTIIEKYIQLVQQENEFEIKDQNSLTTSHRRLYENVHNCPLASRYLTLQETVEVYKKQLKELEEEIINLTIQSIAHKESFKIQEAERERPIKHFYMTEENRAMQELEIMRKECAKTEQEIKDQMASAITAKNTKMGEIKNNLQRQIIEKSTDFFNLQNENRELRKKLDDLKLKAQQNTCKTNSRSNVIYFEEQHLANKKKENDEYLSKKAKAATIYNDKPKNQLLKEATHKTSTVDKNYEHVNFLNENENFVEVTSESTELGERHKFECIDECAKGNSEPAKRNPFNFRTKSEISNEYIGSGKNIKTNPSELKINSMNIDPVNVINLKEPNDVIKQYYLVETTNTTRMMPTLYLGKSKKAKQINRHQYK